MRELRRGGMVVVLKLCRAEGTFMFGVKLENGGTLGAMARVRVVVDGGRRDVAEERWNCILDFREARERVYC